MAITIIFGLLISLAVVVTAGFGYQARARQQQSANGVANGLMEEIRGLPFDKIKAGLLSTDLSGDFNIVDCGGTKRLFACTAECRQHPGDSREGRVERRPGQHRPARSSPLFDVAQSADRAEREDVRLGHLCEPERRSHRGSASVSRDRRRHLDHHWRREQVGPRPKPVLVPGGVQEARPSIPTPPRARRSCTAKRSCRVPRSCSPRFRQPGTDPGGGALQRRANAVGGRGDHPTGTLGPGSGECPSPGRPVHADGRHRGADRQHRGQGDGRQRCGQHLRRIFSRPVRDGSCVHGGTASYPNSSAATRLSFSVRPSRTGRRWRRQARPARMPVRPRTSRRPARRISFPAALRRSCSRARSRRMRSSVDHAGARDRDARPGAGASVGHARSGPGVRQPRHERGPERSRLHPGRGDGRLRVGVGEPHARDDQRRSAAVGDGLPSQLDGRQPLERLLLVACGLPGLRDGRRRHGAPLPTATAPAGTLYYYDPP